MPRQPDGASCGVFAMKFCSDWYGDVNNIFPFKDWDMPRGSEKRKDAARMKAVNMARMNICLLFVLDGSNIFKNYIIENAPSSCNRISSYLNGKLNQVALQQQAKAEAYKQKRK